MKFVNFWSRAKTAMLFTGLLSLAAPIATAAPLDDLQHMSSQTVHQLNRAAADLTAQVNEQLGAVPGSSQAQLPAAPAPRVNNAKPTPFFVNGTGGQVFTQSAGRTRRYLIEMTTHYNPARPRPGHLRLRRLAR